MVVQKLKLYEWFLIYQLAQIKNKSFHLPMNLKVNITRLHSHFKMQNEKFPINAILLLALGIWAEENPEAHKMLFRSAFSFRFLKGDDVRINFPIQLREGEKSMTSAIVFTNPQKKTYLQVQAELVSKLKVGLQSYPITRFVHTSANHFFNRFILKLLYLALTRCPRLYWKKGGGCISLSSLSHLPTTPPVVYPLAFGPTGFTFCFNSIDQVGDSSILQVGVGIDHNCYEGVDIIRLLQSLAKILEAQDETYFSKLTRRV